MARATRSERDAWREVHDTAIEVRRIATGPASRIDAGKIAHFARELQALADRMTDQLVDVGHVNPNPPLIIWGNPPSGSHVMSRRVFSLAYKHIDDGKDYEHPFDPGVTMLTHDRDRCVTLYRPDGKPVAKDF